MFAQRSSHLTGEELKPLNTYQLEHFAYVSSNALGNPCEEATGSSTSQMRMPRCRENLKTCLRFQALNNRVRNQT